MKWFIRTLIFFERSSEMTEVKLSLTENYFKKNGRYDKRIEDLTVEVIQGLVRLSQAERNDFIRGKLNTFVDNTQLHLVGFRHQITENDLLLIKRCSYKNVLKEVTEIVNNFR